MTLCWQFASVPALQWQGAVISCGRQTQFSMSSPSPWIPRSLCLHAPHPLLCSCADQMADTLMGPVLSNGSGLEFDTLTPPIRAACHQEPHRMLSRKCLYCLLEFLWWVWVSGYRYTEERDPSPPTHLSSLCHVGLGIIKSRYHIFHWPHFIWGHPDNNFLGFPLLPRGSSPMQSGLVSRASRRC